MDSERTGGSRARTDKEQTGVRAIRRARRVHPALVVLGIALVVALGVGAVYAYQRFLARPPVSTARLLPAATLAYFSFDVAPGGKQGEAAARLRSAFEAQPGFREAWDRITRPLTGALAQTEQEHPTASTAGEAADLSQYLGGKVTVAVLPLSSDDLRTLRDSALGTAPGEPDARVLDVLRSNMVALVDLDFDALNRRGLLTELKRMTEQPSQASVVERYRDIDIRRFDTGASTVYFALVDGSSTAIAAAAPDPVRIVIDTLREGRSLEGNVTHSGLVSEVPAEQLASLYVNLTELHRSLRLADSEIVDSGPLRDLRGGVLLSLGAYDTGYQLDIASEADLTLLPAPDIDFLGPGGLAINPDARPDVKTLGDVPLDAQAFLVGADLRTPLDQLLELARRNSGSDLSRRLGKFEADTGLDLQTDVAPLLSGDYILSARLERAADGALSPSVVFMLKVANEARARAALDKFAASRGDTGREKIAGVDFHVVGDGLAYGTVAGRAWMVWEGDGSGAAESLRRAIDGLGKGMVTAAEWREKAMVLPRYSNLIVNVDGEALRRALEAGGPVRDRQAYERNVAPFLGPLRYVLIGSASYGHQRVYLSRNHTVVFFGVE